MTSWCAGSRYSTFTTADFQSARHNSGLKQETTMLVTRLRQIEHQEQTRSHRHANNVRLVYSFHTSQRTVSHPKVETRLDAVCAMRLQICPSQVLAPRHRQQVHAEAARMRLCRCAALTLFFLLESPMLSSNKRYAALFSRFPVTSSTLLQAT